MLSNNKIAKKAADRLFATLRSNEQLGDSEKDSLFLGLLKIVSGIKKLPDGEKRLGEIHDIRSTLSAYMYRLLDRFKATDFPNLTSEYSHLIERMSDPEEWLSVATLMPNNLDASLRDVQREAILLINLILSTEDLDHAKLLPRCFLISAGWPSPIQTLIAP